MSSPIPYSGNPLDRVSHLRNEASWLAARLRDSASRFLPFWRLQVLVQSSPTPELGWARTDVLEHLPTPASAVLLGVRDDVAHFAVDLSHLADPLESLGLRHLAEFTEPHTIVSSLVQGDAAIVAQGRGMLTWHARHRYCGMCGKTTSVKEAGYMRECDECDAQHFPRTDPVVIMLTHRGDRCLLGRQPNFPKGMWSTLAGFEKGGWGAAVGPAFGLLFEQKGGLNISEDYFEIGGRIDLELLKAGRFFGSLESTLGFRNLKIEDQLQSDFAFERINTIGNFQLTQGLSLNWLFSAEWEWHDFKEENSQIFLLSSNLSYSL